MLTVFLARTHAPSLPSTHAHALMCSSRTRSSAACVQCVGSKPCSTLHLCSFLTTCIRAPHRRCIPPGCESRRIVSSRGDDSNHRHARPGWVPVGSARRLKTSSVRACEKKNDVDFMCLFSRAHVKQCTAVACMPSHVKSSAVVREQWVLSLCVTLHDQRHIVKRSAVHMCIHTNARLTQPHTRGRRFAHHTLTL
jgi:hypothetical protein